LTHVPSHRRIPVTRERELSCVVNILCNKAKLDWAAMVVFPRRIVKRGVELGTPRLSPAQQGDKVLYVIGMATGHLPAADIGGSTMARAKKEAPKRKRSRKALPAWGAAGMSLAMVGGASAAAVPIEKGSSPPPLPPVFTLGDEELSDISLSKFFVYDREGSASSRLLGEQYAQRGCRGCRGCGGGVRRCGGGGCAVARCGGVRRCGGCGVGCAVVGCARCSCSCCLSWGSCQLC
jgi:hypothetical protein